MDFHLPTDERHEPTADPLTRATSEGRVFAPVRNKMPALQKTAAKLIAGFFALMLLFTIVSRAADGMTIPLVRAEAAKSGTITQRAELTGVIRPLEDLDILLPGNLYITNIKAEIGQKIEVGGVLLEFDLEDVQAQLDEQENSLAIAEARLAVAENGPADPDSNTVFTAELNLKQAQDDYDRLEEKLNRNAARAREDYANAQADLTDAKAKYNEAVTDTRKSLIESAKAKRDSAQNTLDAAKDSAAESVAAAQYSYDTTRQKQGAASLEIQRAYEQLQNAIDKSERSVAEAQKAYDDAAIAYSNALAGQDVHSQQAVVSAQSGVKSAEKALSNAKRSLEDNGTSADDQLLNASRAIAAAQRSLEQAKRDLSEKERTGENSAMQSNVDIITQRAQIASLEKTIAALEEILETGGQLLSPIGGTVQEIAKTGKTQDKAAVATLSRNDTGFRFEAKTDSSTAENLAAGDSGQFTYKDDGASQRTQATITDTGAADADGNCLVIAALPEGSYPSGANGTLTISRSGERQNTCLSVSALRSDNDGDYVFVLQEKKTVTGLEYTARRVDVTVLDRDSALASVQSGLSREDKVITSANKPIAEGDRVRLDES